MSSFENRNNEIPSKLRAYRHIAMGIVYLLLAAMLFYVKQFGTIELSQTSVYIFSALLFVYGVFRIWRGFADLKLNRNQ